MDGKKELMTALAAGYPYFYCSTYEISRTVEDIFQVVNNYTSPKTGENPFTPVVWDMALDPDPEKVLDLLATDDPGMVIIAKNFNWFLVDDYNQPNKSVVSVLQANADEYSGQRNRKVLIIVGTADFSTIPKDLEKDFLPLTFGLPDMEEIRETYETIKKAASQNPSFMEPTEQEEEKVLESCKGMTVRAIKNALAFSLVEEKGVFAPKLISKIRAQGIESLAGVKVNDSSLTFDNLKGYDNLKDFALTTGKSKESLGLLLLGPAGTGKSTFVRALGNEIGAMTYEVEIGQLFGSLVGESEKKMTAAIDFFAANAPCQVILDEIEKGLSGSGGGTQDGGTSVRTTSILLKFLSDGRPPGVRVYGTCNDISKLPPEWVRAERWDTAPFFVDLPLPEERLDILEYYQGVFGVKGAPKNMEGWSGAEIKAACRIAKMMSKDIAQVERYVIPVSKTMGDKISALRRWAVDNTIPASTKMPNGDRGRKVDF